MNKSIIGLLLMVFSFSLYAQENQSITIKDYLITDAVEVFKPAFSDIENLEGEVFKEADLIKYNYLQHHDLRPEKGDRLEWNNFQLLKWKESSADKEDVVDIKSKNEQFQLAYIAFYIENTEWADIELVFKSAQMLDVFIDGKHIKGKYSLEEKGEEKELKINTQLEANNHIIIIKTLLDKEKNEHWSISSKIELKNESNQVNLSSSLTPVLYMDINHLMNGVNIESTKISAAGDYYFIKYKMTNHKGKSQRMTVVNRVLDHQTIQLFYGSDVSSLQWAPFDNILTYKTYVDKKTWIWEYNLDNGKRFPLDTDLEDVGSFTWSPNAEFLVLTKHEKPKEDKTGLKKVEGMADHWPWYRNRSNLFILDVLSGIHTPLTHGYLSNTLHDISQDGNKILFSQSIYDNAKRPYSKQILLMYNKQKRTVDTVWNKYGGGRVQFSPDGEQLLVVAGPAFFGDVGTNLSKATIPNDYDSQAYLYTLNDGSVKPISKNFNPSISNAEWSSLNTDHIYFKVQERTYVNAYVYSISSQEFNKIETGIDVTTSFDNAREVPLVIYHGSSISTPKKAYLANLETGEKQLLDYPEEKFFEDVQFGKNEDWNFTNKDGVTIEGRIYYPPNFDANKKYPMIVYYYGGTSPVERNFRGRYPKNLFAANGYIVYVLQPSGATGYGQDFSAEHVNNWGITVADEIVKGSRLLCQSHSFIDSTKVGCMGASYGGFMTMYLTTHTNFFSAAISHAGISSISSYWGEGYWGYLYSQVASANSFPWNNKDMYIKQSPLFNAEKVNTPILLLHGNADTNVPPGESRQFYTALKLLNKDVELIEIDKQNHHITDYKKRVLWQKTILAWFDKNLKKQNDWWFHLYPKKNL